MEINRYGIPPNFRIGKGLPENLKAVRVLSREKDSYILGTSQEQIRGECTGALMYSVDNPLDLPVTGDWVLCMLVNEGGQAVIHEVLPRKNLLSRKTAGKKVEYQALAANVDHLFIMQSAGPDVNPRRLERYLIMSQEAGLQPIILLSKADLFSEEQISQFVEILSGAAPDCRIIPFSNVSESGLCRIRSLLVSGEIFCVLGSSGVGKSSLINSLAGQEIVSTLEVRESDGRGRHTTTRRQLHCLPDGALLLDTPGIRELGQLGTSESVQDIYDDIVELSGQCKFSNCTHGQEPGCAVQEAIQNGRLDLKRFHNFIKLKKESANNERSYLEKRNRDKAFGKMVRSVINKNPKRRR